MLKTNVANVLFGTNATNGLAGTVQSTTAASQKGLTESFANTFNSAAGKSENTDVNNTNEVKQSKTVVESKPVREVSETKEQPKNKSLDKDTGVSAAKEVVEDAKKVVEKIKDEFDVTDEAIEEAMQVLGLNLQDLFDPKALKDLVMEVTGTTDSIELITNDKLYNGIGNVIDLMSELKDEIINEFNLSEEGFTNIVNDTELFEKIDEIPLTENELAIESTEESAQQASVDLVKNEEPNEQADIVNAKENAVKNDDIKADTNKNIEKTASETTETTVQNAKGTESEIKVDINVESKTTETAKTALENESSTKDNNHQDREDNKNNNEMLLGAATGFNVEANSVGQLVETVQSYATTADSQEIMRQITEYMKVNISSDSTSMEMQLHPASLGTVNMQVISQNGQVSAHFTVQNEAVKAILETQMLTLQETLNEQGTKVSAIEVTVANYNLDKGSENQPNEGNSGNGKKGYGKRSNIDLTSLDSLDDLDEDEMMEAKVMEMNGNTVSYTV